MGSDRIEIKRITDFMVPLAIMEDKIIKDAIYEDGVSPSMPDLIKEIWLSAEISGKIFACYRLHSMSGATCQIHPAILPGYRGKTALQATQKILMWCVKCIPDLNTIVSIIPACHRNVILFARQMGLNRSGIVPKSYRKNGELVDMHIYSISTDEIKKRG